VKSEREIRKHRDDLRTIIENAPEGLCDMDTFLGFQRASAALAVLTWLLDEDATGEGDRGVENAAFLAAEIRSSR